MAKAAKGSKHQRIVEEWRLTFEGMTFYGSGVLTWSPSKGARLTGSVRNRMPEGPVHRQMRSGWEVMTPVFVRLKFQLGHHGLMVVHDINEMILMRGWLDCRSSTLLTRHKQAVSNFPEAMLELIAPSPEARQDLVTVHPYLGVRGAGTYGVSGALLGTEELQTKEYFRGKLRNNFRSFGGISHDDSAFELEGTFVDDIFRANWVLKPGVEKHFAWRLCRTIPAAVGLLTGRYLPTHCYEMEEGVNTWERYCASSEPRSTRLILSKSIHFCSGRQIATFAKALAGDTAVALCLRCLYSDLNISRPWIDQGTFVGRSMEATITTINAFPFRNDPSKLKAVASERFGVAKLRAFCNDVLQMDNTDVAQMAEAFEKLRHKPSHANWINAEQPEGQEGAKKRMELEFAVSKFYRRLVQVMLPEVGIDCDLGKGHKRQKPGTSSKVR